MSNSPWRWVPTAYFMEGLPFVMVVIVSSIMYKNFGLSNAKITYYTGYLMLPWAVKPLWAWFIDLFGNKRQWIYITEMVFALGLALMALTLNLSIYLPLSLAMLMLCAFTSSSHDIAVDGYYLISLTSGEQAFFVGMQSAFYQAAKIFGSGLLVILSGALIKLTNHNIALSWCTVMLLAALTSFSVALYHAKVLPYTTSIHTKRSTLECINEIKLIFTSLFKLPDIWITILFAATFRMGEILLSKVATLFILDSRMNGGLGFNNTYMGISNICNLCVIIAAGILGGICISRFGLKRCLWPMLLLVNLPHLIFVYLAYAMPTDEIVVLALQALEHFATSLSLSAYALVNYHLLRNSQYKTAHYAFITGIMILTNMLPSMASGTLQQTFGYLHYFIFVVLMLLPSILVIPFLKIESEFGIKK